MSEGAHRTVDRTRGRLLIPGPDGYLVNDTSWSLVGPSARECLNDCVDELTARLGPALRSVYVRGSVPRGLAQRGVSDLDLLVVLTDDAADDADARRAAVALSARWQAEAARVDVEPVREREYRSHRDLAYVAFMLKLQALLLWGEDVAAALPPVPPDRRLASTLRYLETRRGEAARRFAEDTDEEFWTAWLMRTYVRAAMESVVEEVRAYTRDLSVCARVFSSVHPELAGAIWAAVELAVAPAGRTDDAWAVVEELEPPLLAARRRLGLTPATDRTILTRKRR